MQSIFLVKWYNVWDIIVWHLMRLYLWWYKYVMIVQSQYIMGKIFPYRVIHPRYFVLWKYFTKWQPFSFFFLVQICDVHRSLISFTWHTWMCAKFHACIITNCTFPLIIPLSAHWTMFLLTSEHSCNYATLLLAIFMATFFCLQTPTPIYIWQFFVSEKKNDNMLGIIIYPF